MAANSSNTRTMVHVPEGWDFESETAVYRPEAPPSLCNAACGVVQQYRLAIVTVWCSVVAFAVVLYITLEKPVIVHGPPVVQVATQTTTVLPLLPTTTPPFFPSDDFTCSGAKGCRRPFVGVNLGGWLLLEDWMWADEMATKKIFDEWTLVQRHGGPSSPRAIEMMHKHWETFVTEEDLDRLLDFGVTHVRIPIGYWLVDYRASDGYVDGSSRYLFRALAWLRRRGMRAVLDLHALPGAQTPMQSFTGRKSPKSEFFRDPTCYARGKAAILGLARLILTYESNPLTSGVVVGMEPVNEPDWLNWATTPGIRQLYQEIVPPVRQLLPSNRYMLLLHFTDLRVGASWLAWKRKADPYNYQGVAIDAHIYHSYGDDDGRGRHWRVDVDSCKTCCRDGKVLHPAMQAGLPVAIGEFSLNTGFPGNNEFWVRYMRFQLSLWEHLGGVIGSFFWNHRIGHAPGNWYQEMSLLDLIQPHGPIPAVSRTNVKVLCWGKDVDKCPTFDEDKVSMFDECIWRK